MLVKFLAHGTGSAQAAADYLTRELDSQGEVRDDVAVLRGDPDAVAAVADALEFDHKYTSGVIAWAPEDRPSDQNIDRVTRLRPGKSTYALAKTFCDERLPIRSSARWISPSSFAKVSPVALVTGAV
jgi:hypothetical protein